MSIFIEEKTQAKVASAVVVIPVEGFPSNQNQQINVFLCAVLNPLSCLSAHMYDLVYGATETIMQYNAVSCCIFIILSLG